MSILTLHRRAPFTREVSQCLPIPPPSPQVSPPTNCGAIIRALSMAQAPLSTPRFYLQPDLGPRLNFDDIDKHRHFAQAVSLRTGLVYGARQTGQAPLCSQGKMMMLIYRLFKCLPIPILPGMVGVCVACQLGILCFNNLFYYDPASIIILCPNPAVVQTLYW